DGDRAALGDAGAWPGEADRACLSGFRGQYRQGPAFRRSLCRPQARRQARELRLHGDRYRSLRGGGRRRGG
ncbi:hypothetical protein PMES_03386, partial [Profundibacterium mesophilum KAUST100406-0324]